MTLGLLSNERLHPHVNWTTLGPPLISALAGHKDTEIIRPPSFEVRNFAEWNSVRSRMRRLEGVFWMQGSSRPELPVHLASLMKIRLNRSAFVIDAWKTVIEKIGFLAELQELNPCFVAFREGKEELQRRYPNGVFEWLPFGVDTDVFCGSPDDERPIFAFWMGRRLDALHNELLSYCEKRNLRYAYRQDGVFLSPSELGRVAAQSKYFLVTPPDLDDPVRTGGFSPFVMRYLEGLAAGSRLLGVLPKSGEYEALLPLDAICQVSPDGADLASKLDRDQEDSEAWTAVRKASSFVRRTHSWQRRAEQIYDRLVNGAPTGFEG